MNLTTIHIPPRVRLGQGAFQYCEALRELDLAHVVITDTGTGFCEGCYKLQRVVLPPMVKVVGRGSFYSCRALRDVQFPPTVERIKRDVFAAGTAVDALDLRHLTALVFLGRGFLCGYGDGDNVSSVMFSPSFLTNGFSEKQHHPVVVEALLSRGA